jgi:hypothetical protein
MTVVPSMPSAQPTDPAVEDELVRLATTPIAQLRLRYAQLFRTDPPKAFGPDLLRRSIAHGIQERAYGGLSRSAQRLLDQMMKAYAAKPGGRIVLPRRIKPGSVLVREWKHKSHRVVVLAEGFEYDGRTFANLSEIAVLITGTRWNGPRFFGLRPKTQDIGEGPTPDSSDGPKRKAGTTSARSNHLGGGSDYRKQRMPKAAKSVSEGSHRGR